MVILNDGGRGVNNRLGYTLKQALVAMNGESEGGHMRSHATQRGEESFDEGRKGEEQDEQNAEKSSGKTCKGE